MRPPRERPSRYTEDEDYGDSDRRCVHCGRLLFMQGEEIWDHTEQPAVCDRSATKKHRFPTRSAK